MDKKNFKLIIDGFETLEDAEVFIEWFGGSGEQELPLWFDAKNLEYSYYDALKPNTIVDNTILLELKKVPHTTD